MERLSVENPWDVRSIYDFSYFCCPECDVRARTKQDFVDHASEKHPKAMDAFQLISDGSLNDVKLPAFNSVPDECFSGLEEKELKSEAIEDLLLNELGDSPSADYIFDDGEPAELDSSLSEDEPLAKKKRAVAKRNAFKSCKMCNFRAKNSTMLVNHVRKIHNTESAHSCHECKEVFQSGHSLKVHLWNIHRQGKGSEKCLCSLCGKTIIGRSNFKKHEREKHGIISAAFVQRRKPTKIECDKCKADFLSPKLLNEHSIECLGDIKNFKCPQCDIHWVSGGSLNAHLKIDHGFTEMYTCNICGKCLKKKASLESHVKVEHEKIKDHICHLCGSGFARAQGLRFHMQRVHEHSGKAWNMDIIEENPWCVSSLYDFSYFCCPECDTKWQDKQEFADHAFFTHPKAIVPLQQIVDGSIDGIKFSENLLIKTEDAFPLPGSINENSVLQHQSTTNKLSIEPASKSLWKSKRPSLKLVDSFEEGLDSETCGFEHAPSTKKKQSSKKSTKKVTVTCYDCNEQFPSEKSLKDHVEAKHSSDECLCTLCGQTIIGRIKMLKHERVKHHIGASKKRQVPRKLNCSKCFSELESPGMLDKHLVVCQEANNSFACQECGTNWAAGESLNAHMKIDHGTPSMYTCNKCGKCFKRNVSLRNHMKIEHYKIKDHVCHICAASFTRASGLQFHMQRIHEHSGKYACTYCDFRTVSKNDLGIHVNAVHTKAEKFHCEECTYFAYHRQGLLTHIKNVHLKLKPHKCQVCNEAYVRRKELEKHRALTGHYQL